MSTHETIEVGVLTGVALLFVVAVLFISAAGRADPVSHSSAAVPTALDTADAP